jgi:hypothetical protein
MSKDYSERNHEQIVEWNARAREVHEREICNKAIATKQRVPRDFWFKPYIRKFSGEEFVKKICAKTTHFLVYNLRQMKNFLSTTRLENEED